MISYTNKVIIISGYIMLLRFGLWVMHTRILSRDSGVC